MSELPASLLNYFFPSFANEDIPIHLTISIHVLSFKIQLCLPFTVHSHPLESHTECKNRALYSLLMQNIKNHCSVFAAENFVPFLSSENVKGKK